MFRSIVSNIICSTFDTVFGRQRGGTDLVGATLPSHAMVLKFNLGVGEIEEGYRHLHILIFGGGSNYIGVYAKLDWTVILLDDLTDEDDPQPKREYTKGETPWVLKTYHDSCWRDGVNDLLREFDHRIYSIDSLFNGETGWYKMQLLTPEKQKELRDVLKSTPGYSSDMSIERSKRVNVADLEFKFEVPEHEHILTHCAQGAYCTFRGCKYVE